MYIGTILISQFQDFYEIEIRIQQFWKKNNIKIPFVIQKQKEIEAIRREKITDEVI